MKKLLPPTTGRLVLGVGDDAPCVADTTGHYYAALQARYAVEVDEAYGLSFAGCAEKAASAGIDFVEDDFLGG